MQIIYFSPHFDDAVLSCGGLIWEQINKGHEVSIWTIFSGDPPLENLSEFAKELHSKWQGGEENLPNRREEDIVSCNILGVHHFHIDLLDCIYRVDTHSSFHLYPTEEAIFSTVYDLEFEPVELWTNKISNMIPKGAVLVSPLGIGNHVDHQITRRVLEKLNQPLQYYIDFPYMVREAIEIDTFIPKGYAQQTFPISKRGLKMWQDGVEAHQSQISSFWSGNLEMREDIRKFEQKYEGINIIIKK